MKAISLIQPWATLVALGIKRIETRSWQTGYRGPLAIHASAAFPKAARLLCQAPAFRYALRTAPTVLPRGAVLCTCQLTDIQPTSVMLDQLDFGLPFGGSILEQMHFGDFSPGRFAWELREIYPLSTPIPAKGSLSLWEWEERMPS